VTNLLLAAVSAVLATNQPVAISNLVQAQTGLAIPVATTNDPVEQALQKLMQADDEARAEVDKWIQENQAFTEKGAGVPRAEMNRRIRERFVPIRKGYEELIQQHTNRADILIAFASYLGETGEEEVAIEQLEKARGLDAKDPAIWNNLANLYGHNGEVKKSFEYYAQAIELDPTETVYYHNFGTTVFLFRKDAKEFYNINEQQVFDKALNLYSNAIRLDPLDFKLAADVAQTFYGIQPPRNDDALRAWTNAFNLATDDSERQGVHTHFARVKLKAGQFAEAQAHLNAITNAEYADLKRRLTQTLESAKEKASSTNAPASTNTVDRPAAN
jgi:tetratricopeptide (TPR) repeat protein